MNKHIKSCIIIYGWTDNCLDKFYEENSPLYNDNNIILIEPRKQYIDIINTYCKINSKKLTNFIFIKKCLGNNNKLKESILYYDKSKDLYLFENTEVKIREVLKREVVYQTTFTNIINIYNIQNIKSIIININVNNCYSIFENIIPFNHIISQIKINRNIKYPKTSFFNNFIETNDTLPTNDVDGRGTLASVTPEYYVFSHKNLNISLPNIAIYFSDFDLLQNNIGKLKLFIHQYQMNLILNKSSQSKTNNLNLIPYPDCINEFNDLSNFKNLNIKTKKIYHQNIINNLENLFTSTDIPVKDIDIIIQFQTKFLNNNILHIMYPLKDNVLYVNKIFDVIYATKNCMYMLYQILKSKYFTDYMDDKMNTKPRLFNFFSKTYFYEYISKIFIIKDI